MLNLDSLAGFVDDCNGQTNLFEHDGSRATVKKLISHAQDNAQQWTDLLHASAGALELTKCSSHILQWQFSMTGTPVLTPSHTSDGVTITVWESQTNSAKNLQLLPAYTAHKTLGHYKDPAGTQREQYRQLKRKSENNTDS